MRDPLITHLSPERKILSFLPSSHLVDPSPLASLAPLPTFSASSLSCRLRRVSSFLLLLSSLHVFCGGEKKEKIPRGEKEREKDSVR